MEVVMHFNPDFRTKFVSYLANGIPVSIADDEIPLFYKALSNYINDAKNDFMAFYSLGDDCVVLSDRQDDYLRVAYEKDKIEFFTIANQINTQDDPLSYHLFSNEELEKSREKIRNVADGIRSGSFETNKGDFTCQYCDYKDFLCPAWED